MRWLYVRMCCSNMKSWLHLLTNINVLAVLKITGESVAYVVKVKSNKLHLNFKCKHFVKYVLGLLFSC